MALQLMPMRIIQLLQIKTTVIMILIMATIEKILSQAHIKYLMTLRLLRNTFIKNYKETLEKQLQDRLIHTRLNKKIGKNIITTANDITKDILETIENPNF